MSEEILWEIIDLIDQGDIVYLHRTTNEVVSHPDPKRWEGAEYQEMINEARLLIDVDPEAYITLEPPEPKESFVIMETFVQTIQDDHLKRHLSEALHSKKPFRYFRTAVEDSVAREDWFDFKDAWMKVWLMDTLEREEGQESEKEA